MLGHLHRTLPPLALLFGFLVSAGCGGSSQAVTPARPASQEAPKKPPPEKRPLAYYEATLRPSDFDRELEAVERVHVEESKRQELVIPRDSLVLEEVTVLGFRIQILSTSSIDEATVSKLTAQQLFLSDSVYVVYDPPVYKVRVGDFPTRLEANGKLPEVQERGYQDAWVVPDKVVRRKWVAVRPEGRGAGD